MCLLGRGMAFVWRDWGGIVRPGAVSGENGPLIRTFQRLGKQPLNHIQGFERREEI